MTHPVLCVSAGLTAPKKRDNLLSRQHLYLNYGLVGLATLLARQGRPAQVFHGNFHDPTKFAADLGAQGLLPVDSPLLLSLPSSFAIPWANEFCRSVKAIAPRSKIVVGGRWVVAQDGGWIRARIPGVDLVVFGTAETRILSIAGAAAQIPFTDRALSQAPEPPLAQLPTHDYSLLHRFTDFQPAVEVSRGCGMGCSFCAEASVKLSEMKDAELVAEELRMCSDLYGGSIRPYFQASYFRPSTHWIAAFGKCYQRLERAIPWRTETRVDGLSPPMIEMLARSGLAVLDLGLESASASQLVAMGKSRTPSTYLRRASELLRACKDNGVWAKVNVLLYPGETRETIEETVTWLQQHRSLVKGVSVGPTIVYRYGSASAEYLASLKRLGAWAVDDHALDQQGYALLHLSNELSHEESVAISMDVSRQFMSSQDYYDLKSFSYFPRTFTFDNFVEAAQRSDPASLPFFFKDSGPNDYSQDERDP
jgi:radical SAM superfamily enzyme YgiQ (UPF0313 family)